MGLEGLVLGVNFSWFVPSASTENHLEKKGGGMGHQSLGETAAFVFI